MTVKSLSPRAVTCSVNNEVDDDVLEEQDDLIPSKSTGDEPRRRRDQWNTSFRGSWGFLLGLLLGFVASRSLDLLESAAPASALTPFVKHTSDTITTAPADGPTFVILVGIEGTGHHFIQSLVKKSPTVLAMRELGAHVPIASVRRSFIDGLMMPHCDGRGGMPNPEAMYRNLTASLREAKELLKSEPLVKHVSINALQGIEKSDNHELSYPDSLNCNRIKHPNLDMFYKACDDAQAKCAAVYLYRDPYAVVNSNTKRHFNTNVQQGIHLYTMMLQVIYAQLSYAPDKILACIGLYDDSAPDEERWHPIRDLFGWTDADAFRARVTTVYRPHTPMSQEQKDDLVSPEYRHQMRAMVSAHDKVVERCRAIVRENSQAKTGVTR